MENTKALISLPKKEFCVGEPITFENNSTGANIYNWRFGDGTTSNQKEPTKVYQDSGTYVVRLLVSAGSNCLRDTTDTIHVQKVIADYSMSRSIICQYNDTIQFFNNSTNADSSKWIFDYGMFSRKVFINDIDSIFEMYHLSRPFDFRNGYYTDSLVVWSNRGCSDTLVLDSNRQINLLNTLIEPVDSFHNLENIENNFWGGCVPLFGIFSHNTVGYQSGLTWNWNLNGVDTGFSDTTQNFTFLDTNNNKLFLKVENDLGCIASDTLYIRGGTKIFPSFIVTADTVCGMEINDTLPLLKVTSSSSLIQKYEFFTTYLNGFDLEDEKTEYTPIHKDTGYASVSLKSTSFGCDTFITIDSAFYVLGPIARFLPSISNLGCLDRTVFFEGVIRGATWFAWDFGDGSALDTTNETPTHQYSKDSLYYVTLRAFNNTSGCDTSIWLDSISFSDINSTEIFKNGRNFCFRDTAIFESRSEVIFKNITWFAEGIQFGSGTTSLLPLDTNGIIGIELLVEDRNGCLFSFFDTIFVSKTIAQIDTTIIQNCNPLRVAFEDISITDTTIVSWRWHFGNNDTSFLKSDTSSYLDIGNYNVFLYIRDSVGCEDSILVKDLIVIEENNLSFLSGNPRICKGDSVTFRNTSTATNPQFTWDFGDGTQLVNNNEFVSHRYQDTGTYTVRLFLIDNNGCLIEHVKPNLIQVEGIPSIDFVADTLDSDCYPLGVNFTDISTGNISQWEWRFGNGASSILKNPFANYTRPGSFDVFLKVTTPNGCTDSILKSQYINTRGPIADFNIDKDTICINELVRFEITSFDNVASFLWDFGDGNSSAGNPVFHNYNRTGLIKPSLILTDTTGTCTVALEEELFVFDIFSDFTVSVDSGCVPLRINLNKNSRGENNFLWRFGDGSNSTEPNPSITYNEAGRYSISLEISSENGCRDTARKDIIARPKPTAIVSDNEFICIGDTVQLAAQGGINYLWQPDSSLSSSTNPIVLAYPITNTSYLVQVSNVFNCIDSATIFVKVQQKPNFNSLQDTTIIVGEKLQLNVSAGIGFIYKWTPSEGLSCDDCPNPIANPLKSQTYIVEISDSLGCFFITDTINIEVIELFTLDVPSTFTPNGDGVNDVIYAKGAGLKELLAFKIYNRFGELVFETNDFNIGWDGTYRGEPQNMETYIYTVEALTFGDKVLSKKGNISLLR